MVSLLLISLICASFGSASIQNFEKKPVDYTVDTVYHPKQGVEYWGLIFAVGTYYNNPKQDRPSMLEAADDLYDVLIDSPHWQPDHIHILKGAQATGQNLIRELLWLSQMDDADDITLIYLTTHGSPLRNNQGLPVDLPPKDEQDGADEILIMHHGFENWYAFVWDDLLNFLISRLDSFGVCVIVDSCFSGGFNDVPMFARQTSVTTYNAEHYSKEMTAELSGQNRVVLMSSQENEVSYGSDFSEFLIQGLWGWGDFFGNQDGVNSAEEAFDYAEFWVDLLGNQNPTILDLYSGELPLTS